MGQHRSVNGVCHVCGAHGMLTREHIPPRKAYDGRDLVLVDDKRLFDMGPGEAPTGTRIQGGYGVYTLCGKCNNDTGAWYGAAFVDWCVKGREVLARACGRPALVYAYQVYPLRVLKQIVCMFCSLNGSSFADKRPAVRKFVLDRAERQLDPAIGLYAYYNPNGQMRATGITARGNTATGEQNVFSELTYPPFGYVMTLGSRPPDDRLGDITHFVAYRYDERRTIEAPFPVLPVVLAIPADYRTEAQIRADAASAVDQG